MFVGRAPTGAIVTPRVQYVNCGDTTLPVVCKGTQQIMPKGGYLSIVPGDVELVVMEPIPTAGLGYEDRATLLETVRAKIAEELKRPIA